MRNGYYPKGKNGFNRKVKLRKSLASEHNLSLILKFINERSIMQRWKSKCTTKNYIFSLHSLAEFIKNKKFEDVNKDDTIEYFGYLMKRINIKTDKELKRITVDIAKARIKSFFRWLYNGECPPFLKDMKTNLKPITVTSVEILTEEEVSRLIQAANNIRDKTIVAVLYESGCRIGEFLNMRIRDVKFDEYGAIMNVNGKTGERGIRIVHSVPYLKEWLRYHPDKKEESWLWLSKNNKDIKKITYLGVWFTLKDLARRANIPKNVRPHILRHSRITHTALKLKESAQRMIYGWTPGSDMPRIYTHLTGMDVDESVLWDLYGKNKGKKEKKSLIEPKICFNCGQENPSDYDFCSKCKIPLSIDEIEAKEKNFLLPIIQRMIDRTMEELKTKKAG